MDEDFCFVSALFGSPFCSVPVYLEQQGRLAEEGGRGGGQPDSVLLPRASLAVHNLHRTVVQLSATECYRGGEGPDGGAGGGHAAGGGGQHPGGAGLAVGHDLHHLHRAVNIAARTADITLPCILARTRGSCSAQSMYSGARVREAASRRPQQQENTRLAGTP